MQYKIDRCAGCKQKRPLINRKHSLCGICNHKRLNPEPKQKEKKLQKKVRKRTKQQERIEKLLHEVYKEIALEREHRCTGCGTYQNLSHSHLIPRSRSRRLITCKSNIVYHCLGSFNTPSCHLTWESGTLEERKQMRDFEANMRAVRELDIEYYYLRGGE